MQLPLKVLRRTISGVPRINTAHHLAAGLKRFWLYSGWNCLELITGSVTRINVTFMSPVNSIYGTIIQGNSSGVPSPVTVSPSSNTVLGITTRLSIAALLNKVADGVGEVPFGRPAAATHTDPFLDFGIFLTTNLMEFRVSTGAGSVTVDYTATDPEDGKYHLVGGTWDGTTMSAMMDLNTPATGGQTGTLSDGGQPFILFGDRSNTESWNGNQVFNAVWNRALSNTEWRSLYNDPFGMLIWPEDDLFAELVGSGVAADTFGNNMGLLVM